MFDRTTTQRRSENTATSDGTETKANAEQQIQNIRKQLDDRLLKLDYISQKLEVDCQAYPVENINNSTIDPQVNHWLSQ